MVGKGKIVMPCYIMFVLKIWSFSRYVVILEYSHTYTQTYTRASHKRTYTRTHARTLVQTNKQTNKQTNTHTYTHTHTHNFHGSNQITKTQFSKCKHK